MLKLSGVSWYVEAEFVLGTLVLLLTGVLTGEKSHAYD